MPNLNLQIKHLEIEGPGRVSQITENVRCAA